MLPKRRNRFHTGVRLPLLHKACISFKLRLWKFPALYNITGVAKKNNDHWIRDALPIHIGPMRKFLVGFFDGTKLMKTTPMMKVGMATMTENTRR